MNIINGMELSQKYLKNLKEDIVKLKIDHKKTASIALIVVGNDLASKIYIKNKVKACNDVGIESKIIKLNNDINKKELLTYIDGLNCDDTVDAILVQLPLPEHIDEREVIERVSPNKDVDGFTCTNIGKLSINSDEAIVPCTPLGIINILKSNNTCIEGSNIVIIGRSNIVGKPLALILTNMGATVTICNSKTKDLKSITIKADVLISAAASKGIVTADMVKESSVVIDVAINRDENNRLCGDVCFNEVKEKVNSITPVPNGVGPMTIAMLMLNTYKLAKRNL